MARTETVEVNFAVDFCILLLQGLYDVALNIVVVDRALHLQVRSYQACAGLNRVHIIDLMSGVFEFINVTLDFWQIDIRIFVKGLFLERLLRAFIRCNSFRCCARFWNEGRGTRRDSLGSGLLALFLLR